MAPARIHQWTRRAGVLALALGAAHAAVGGPQRWVHGSWVNVRSAPAADAPVLTHLVVNTPVELVSGGEGRFCAITWGAQKQGHVACNLLGEAPLTLEQVSTPNLPQGRPNPHFSPARAFWLAPSAARLIDMGRIFWTLSLSPEQQRQERPDETTWQQDARPPRLVRFPVPEFEAMKALLRDGVVAAAERAPALQAAEEANLGGLAGIALPALQPSLFRSAAQLAPPNADVEHVSARFGLRETARTLRGPRWGVTVAREFVPRYDGAWDIGALEVRLLSPAVRHVIGRQGFIAAQRTAMKTVMEPDADSTCADTFGLAPEDGDPLPGHPRVKDPLAWFYVPQALAATRARITSHTHQVRAADEAPDAPLRRLVVHQIDIDGDRVPDLLAWERWGPSQLDPDGEPLRRETGLLANIGGRWWLLAIDTIAECT